MSSCVDTENRTIITRFDLWSLALSIFDLWSLQSARRRAPCPALRHDIFDGKTYEQVWLIFDLYYGDQRSLLQIFLYAHKSGCSEEETRTAIGTNFTVSFLILDEELTKIKDHYLDMARRQRIEQYALKYVYPVLFYSRTRGWIKVGWSIEVLTNDGWNSLTDYVEETTL